MDDSQPQAPRRYPVRLVASHTGLSPHVLRAWERRYGVVVPVRTPGGQRLYSDLDIARLRLLRRLTEHGHAISRIATLPLEALQEIDQSIAGSGVTSAPDSAAPVLDTDSPDVVDSALRATRRLDHETLQSLLERAAVTLGAPDFLDVVAAPVLNEIGRNWAEGTLSVAQEHMATAVFRRVLGWLLGVYEVKGSAPRLVVATPPGEMHELGAMMVAVAAAAAGWSVTYLGPDLPVTDLLNATKASGAHAVALSTVHVSDHAALAEAIRHTREGLAPGVALLLGGAAAQSLSIESGDDDVLLAESLHDLRTLLGRLATRRQVWTQPR
jgi:MerR family transcriptional regulator, light-induced transcriptional regulator